MIIMSTGFREKIIFDWSDENSMRVIFQMFPLVIFHFVQYVSSIHRMVRSAHIGTAVQHSSAIPGAGGVQVSSSAHL